MEKIEYKCEMLGIAFKGMKNFGEQLQELLNERAAEGWKLHSYHFAAASYCCVVFERSCTEK